MTYGRSTPLRRAERRVITAAIRYCKWLGGPPPLPERDYPRPTDNLIAACHALKKARNL